MTCFFKSKLKKVSNDLDIGASVELLLIAAASAALAGLPVAAPAVASVVLPLHDAMRAGESGRKLDLRRPLPFTPRVHLEFSSAAIGELKRSEAFRSGALFGVVRGANAELHPSLVVGGHHGRHRDGAASLVGLSDVTRAPFSAGLVWSWMRTIPGISANSALHAQLLLVHKTAAVALVVVVVGWSREAISPSRGSPCWILQVSMTLYGAQVDETQESDEH